MFNARELMTPYFASLTSKGGMMDFHSKLKTKPTAMNWADPWRPNDTIPPHIKKATIDCINSTGAHYTFPMGDPELLAELAKRVKKINKLDVDPMKNLTVVAGSDIAFLFVARPFIAPGDEIMIPTPSYANNYATAPLLGGVTVEVPTYPEDNYKLRIDEFEKRVTDKTKIILFTNPNNPTSTVYTRENLKELADFAKKHNLMVIVDQAFEDVTFDGHELTTITEFPDMFERTIIISSLSKGMALCGYRVAYVVASEDITDMLHSITVPTVGVANTAAQAGITAGLRDTTFMEEYRQEYMARAEILDKILSDIPNISYPKPESSFFFWIDISHYGTDQEVVEYLAEHAAVLVSNGKGFGSNKHIRLIYGTLQDRNECIAAVERVRDALINHPNNK